MNELLPEVSIARLAQAQLSTALIENKITIIKGLKGTGKMDAVVQAIQTLNLNYSTFNRTNYQSKEDKYGWEDILEANNEVPYLIFDQAEYLPNWDAFLEKALATNGGPSIVLISSFQPILDEAYELALENAGALIHWLPISFYEMAQHIGMGNVEAKLEEVLVYGSLPEVLNRDDKQTALEEILGYWEKGQWSKEERINKREQQIKVLKTLAFQMGEVISYNEIATKVGLDNETVERYILLFEQAFLIQIVPCLTTGKKYEMKKGITIYFTDNGVRNALIQNFTEMDWRQDADQLWRNWLLIERQKWCIQKGLGKQLYTWRSLTKTAVDIVEVDQESMIAYQVAFNKKEKKKFPAGFKNNYPEAKCTLLNRATYWSFLSSKK